MSSHLFNVAGKNVLITGGSRGIGLMIADSFAKAGANIFLTSRDANACRNVADQIPFAATLGVNFSSGGAPVVRLRIASIAKH